MPLTPQSIQTVKSILDGATSEGPTGIPGVAFIAIDKSGKTLVEHAAGTKSINSQSPIDLDTTFWIASMTKIVTTIAVLQLVEKGTLSLDDPETVKKYAPEIGQKKVYADGVTPQEQERPVTLRQLLAHTAGFGYTFFDPRVYAFGRPAGIDEFSGDIEDIVNQPLVNQPGSVWEYGINIDWAGIILERATSTKLGTYFRTHIFDPLDLSPDSLSLFPTPTQQKNIAHIHQRSPTTGAVTERNHLYRRAFTQVTPEQQDSFFHSGGAGLFAKPREYIKILAALLNDGVSPHTGAQILKKETVDEMFTNQIPEHPNFARGGLTPPNLELANPSPEMYPQPGNPPQGWGLSWFLTIEKGATGRGANTAWWAGIANLYYWVDRERGVAGVIASQVLPFGDGKVIPTWVGVEKAVYDGLE